ncbi:hypothetical protein [Flavobacterium sp. K5-23]|uniref:hypothetical protein n=1 Tax=Flavobacterium sp. K5-23 TaxID=2746225 RepID=UPI00200F6EBC|nr:hypothetical protein [Flavobacterium sp. K5-23]UQD56922.1 hypothetical protein FLAK523_11210 [Flavobacterium sp. K5-23]
MKKIFLVLMVTFVTFSCSNESVNLADASAENNQNLTSKSANSMSNWGDYNINVSVSTDGSEWTYLITRKLVNAKNLSHFIIDLNNCGEESATFGDIIGAKVNGLQADLSPTEGSGTTCNPQAITTNFVKFNNLPAATSWVLVLKFDRGYETFTTATGWIKAGSSCNSGQIAAPGCPKTARCSYSQGYFFANGATHNAASNFWTNGLTIGGVNYSQANGNEIWSIDRGRGGDQTLNAFFQLGAARLSGAESSISSSASIIDMYFNGLDVMGTKTIITPAKGNGPAYSTFVLPATSNGVTKEEVFREGTIIGYYIDTHHCQ